MKTKVLAVLVTSAVGVASALVVGPAHAIPAGDPADERPAPHALDTPSGEANTDLDSPKQQAPAFSINASQHIHGRAGGTAVVNVDLSRRHGSGVNASDLVVVLTGSPGVRVTDAVEYTPIHSSDDGQNSWSCAPVNGTSQRCEYQDPLASGQLPDGLRATVALPNGAAATRSVKATATWTEAQVSPGGAGEATDPVDPENPTRTQSLSDTVELSVDPRLSVALASATGAVVHVPASGGTDQDRTGHLVAKIGGLHGRDASATWEQTAGPQVTFGRATEVNQPSSSVGQYYVIPAGTSDGTRLTFRFTATSNGQSASAVRNVVVKTHAVGTFDGRPELVSDLAQASRAINSAPRRGLTINRAHYRVSIGGAGVRRVVATPRSQKRLKRMVLTAGHPVGVRNTTWRIVSGRPGLLAGAVRNPTRISIAVPRSPGIWMLRATTVLRNGKRASRSKIIKVVAPRATKRNTPKALDLRAADAKSTKNLCSLSAGSVINFADKSTLTLPSTFSMPAKCTSTTSIPFSGAAFVYDGVALGSATGVMSGANINLRSLTLQLPAKVASALPSGVPTTFTVTPPAATPITASQTNGKWSAWTGSFSIPWLSFIPVPSGWTTPNGVFTLAPIVTGSKVTGANLTYTQESMATDGSGGSASMDMTFSTAGPSDVALTVANIGLFQAGNGNQIEFSGTGKFYLSQGSNNSIVFGMTCSAPNSDGSCTLANGFSLAQSTKLTWTQNQGLSLTGATATVGSGTNAYTFALAGTYAGVGNWSLSVNNSGSPWTIGDTGATLSDFSGSVSESPKAGNSELVFDIDATVNNLNVDSAIDVSSATAEISNQCAQGTSNCTPGEVTVSITVAGNATLVGQQLDFNATADLNLSSMTFDFDTSETLNTDFGPAGLNITSVKFTLTNESLTGSCQPAGGNDAPNSDELSLGITATGSAYGDAIEIGGDINGDGYCVWAALGDFSSGSFNGQDIVLAYSSYGPGATLTLPSNAGDPTAGTPSENAMTVNVPAANVLLTGGFTMPNGAIETLGLPPGTSTFNALADVNLSSFSADVDYQLDSPVIIGGGDSTNSVATTISDVQVKIGYTTSPAAQASLSLVVDGDVVVAKDGATCSAASDNPAPGCSYTPVGGSIAINVSGGSVSLNIQVGVETSDGPINNAFGEDGLSIDNLAIAASVGVPGGISLSVNADATLPSSWTSDIALINNAPVSLAFDISETSPCLVFSIGEENSGTTYLDIANAGVVTASYVNFVIAPTGCTVPVGAGSSKQIPAGYGFAFEGAVLGDATTVMLNVSFDPTIVSAQLDLQGFDLLGVLAMDQTSINLNMNSGNDSFDVQFSGGFSLGDPSIAGGQINVNGDVIKTDNGDFTLVLGGNGNVNLVDVVEASISSDSGTCPGWTQSLSPAPNNCLVAIQQQDGKVTNADVSANISMGLLGVTLWGDIDLIYSDGNLQDFHLGLGANIGFWVGDVSGTVFIDYCRGTLSPNGDGTTNGNSCDIGGSNGTFRVYFDGTYSVGPCGDHWWDDECWTGNYSTTVVDDTFSTSALETKSSSKARAARVSAQSAAGFAQTLDISPPAGKTTFGHPADPADYSLNLLWNKANVIGWTGTANESGGYTLTDNVVVAAVAPATVGSAGGCTEPTLGMSWQPTQGTNNPAPTNTAPTSTTCALEVVYATPGANVDSDSDFGGNGSVIGEGGFAAWSSWATTNSQNGTLRAPGPDWFNAPQRGYAVCTPDADGQATCVLRDADLAPLGTLISGAASNNATSQAGADEAHTKLVTGLLRPIGTVPTGVDLPGGTSVWSADGQYRLVVTEDGALQLWQGTPNSYPDDLSGGSPIWQVGGGQPGGIARVNGNGRLELVAADGIAYWSSPAVSNAVDPFLVVGGSAGLYLADQTRLSTPLWTRS